MTRRATPPFRADHVGSYLRPAALHTARAAFAAGKIDAAELNAIEDEAIRDVVRLQEDAGLQAATDGEFRREQWHADFLYAIPGIERGALGPALPVYKQGRDDRVGAQRHADHRQGPPGDPDLRRPLHVPEEHRHHGYPEDHHPLPQHGSLPG